MPNAEEEDKTQDYLKFYKFEGRIELHCKYSIINSNCFLYRISGFIRWEVIFAFFASDEEFAKIVKLLL